MVWWRYNASGDDQGEGLLDRHVNLNHPFHRYHSENARGGCQCMGKIDPNTGTQFIMDLTVRGAGDESYAVNAATGVFHDNHFLETLSLVHEKAVSDPFNSLVYASDKWDLADNTFTECDNLCSKIASCYQTADQYKDNRDNHSQTRYMEIKQRVRLVLQRDDPQEVIHDINDEKKDIDRQSCRNDDRQTGQKDILDFFLQHNPFYYFI